MFFNTTEGLVGTDLDTARDIYERRNGTTTLISTGPDGGNGAFNVQFGGISLDGTRVFFETRESLISGDTDGACPDGSEPPMYILQCFDVYERSNGNTTLGVERGQRVSAQRLVLSAVQEGDRVFFDTTESLLPADSDGTASGTCTSARRESEPDSRDPSEAPALTERNSRRLHRRNPGLLPDLRELVSADTDATWLDMYERNAGTTTLITTGPTARTPMHPALARQFPRRDPRLLPDRGVAREQRHGHLGTRIAREAPIAGYPRPLAAAP